MFCKQFEEFGLPKSYLAWQYLKRNNIVETPYLMHWTIQLVNLV